MKLGLVVNSRRTPARRFTGQLHRAAERAGLELVALADAPNDLPRWSGGQVDVVLAAGGDGTVLEAVRRGLEHDSPVLGFNLGTIGFLAEAEPEQIDRVMQRLVDGDYQVEERMTVAVRVGGGPPHVGVNDVVIEKIDSQRLVVLDVVIDGDPFLTYRADGLVVATATGSTAYAFSAGGPLIDPAVASLLVTPVAPHSLFDRTLVLQPSATISVRVAAERSVRVSVDGIETGTLHLDGVAEVGRGPTPARFVRLDGMPFPTRVVRKFGLS